MKNSSFFVWPLYLPHHIVNKNIVCVYFYVNKNVFILFKTQVMFLSNTSIQVHKNNITFPLNAVVVRFWPSLQRYYCTVCAYYTTFYIIYVTRLDLNSNGQFLFSIEYLIHVCSSASNRDYTSFDNNLITKTDTPLKNENLMGIFWNKWYVFFKLFYMRGSIKPRYCL